MKRLQLIIMMLLALPIGMLAQGSTWQEAITINLGETGSYSLDKNKTEAWFKIEVPEEGRVVITQTLSDNLEMRWVEICRPNGDQTPVGRTSMWWMKNNDALEVTDIGKGTYYLHVSREGGAGTCTLKYDFTPCPRVNDAEPNDNVGEGDEIAAGQTVEGRIGYLDANDYRDNDDCYKIVVPQDGRIQLITTCQKEYDLEFRWMEVCYQKEDQTYPSRTSKWWMVNDTLAIEDAGVGTYYIHLNREKGHGGYSLTYIFTPNEYANDAEPNDNVGEGDEIAIGQTVQGHIGYLDANNYRDNDDCYKIVVPLDGRVQLITSCQKDYDLQFRWMEVCYQKEDQTYPSRTSKWWMVNDTLTIEDVGAGTYYLHLNRERGHGGYTLKYLLTPNNFPNDAEPNEEMEQVTQVIGIGETMTGHLGYLNDNDKRDNEDWIKLDTSAAATMMVVAIEPDTTSTLRLRWADIVRVKGDKSDVVANQWWINELTTLTVNDIDDADYYVHICREQGQGGYSISYNARERSADSQIRVSFIGRRQVRLGVPTDYTVTLKNITGTPTGEFFFVIPYSDEYKLVGAKLPGKDGYVEEVTVREREEEEDKGYWFLVPGLQPYEEYSFTIIAEGRVDSKNAREVIKFKRRKGDPMMGLWLYAASAIKVAGAAKDAAKHCICEVANTYIDLDLDELNKYRENIDKDVDKKLVKYVEDKGVKAVSQDIATEYVVFEILDKIPYVGPVISVGKDIYDVADGVGSALVRRWKFSRWKAQKRAEEANKKILEQYNLMMLDEKLGCNEVVQSFDPNEMCGPVGVGDENYIPETHTMDYRILFENKAEATAPAYRIRITDELDPDVFDVSTVRFNGTSHEGIKYNWKMSREANKLSWDIEGIELPPNVNASEGEGYVSFSVDLKPGLKNGTQIKNKATIIFDYNEPIVTNEYLNTLDLVAPTSEMTSAIVKNDTVTITCEGKDDESDVGYCLFYASYNNEDYEFIGVGEDSFDFALPTGTNATDYKFYALAVDNVGNTQQTAPDAISIDTGIHEITYNAFDGAGWTVYTLKGVKVAHGDGPMQLALPAGVYVIRNGKSARKVIIK